MPMSHSQMEQAQSALRADSKRGLSGSFSTAPIRANCLTLNQKKCKFLYDQDNCQKPFLLVRTYELAVFQLLNLEL